MTKEMPERRVYLWSDKFTREPGKPPTFTDRPDEKHHYPNYSIHPYGRKKSIRR